MATKAGTGTWCHTEWLKCIAVTITAANASTLLLLALWLLVVTNGLLCLCNAEALWHHALYRHSSTCKCMPKPDRNVLVLSFDGSHLYIAIKKRHLLCLNNILKLELILTTFASMLQCLQCCDAVGWAVGRASGL